MLELRRDDLQLFIIHYSFFCVCFVLLYMGNFEFKLHSKNRYPLKKSLLKLHCPYHELLDLDRIQMFPLIAGMVPI
jgi:hypothetical protein